MSEFLSVVLIIGATILYGAVHSLLASHTLKSKLELKLGRAYRLFFNAFASITLLPLLALVPLLPDRVLYRIPWPISAVMGFIEVIAVLAAIVTLLQTDVLRFLGIRQVLQTDSLSTNTLQLTGMYRWVRHPLYFFSLIFLWFSPIMTLNQLTLYSGFSLYFYFGSILEERKLKSQFGEVYQQYQQQVPMLIPFTKIRKKTQ